MQALNQRSRDIFKQIVETYLETGEPVGSRTLSRAGIELSAASIRNVMSDLTELGLLDAPHVSAGRMPTHAGLRLFVDGFLEMGDPGVVVTDPGRRCAPCRVRTAIDWRSALRAGEGAGRC